METEKIGVREFRENLAGYLEAGKPIAITRHGETLGFYIPAQKKNHKAEVEAMRAAAKELDAMITAWGKPEEELMQEYKEIRRTSREKTLTSSVVASQSGHPRASTASSRTSDPAFGSGLTIRESL